MIFRAYSADETRVLYSDPCKVKLRWLRENYPSVFEAIERQAVTLGLTQPTQSGPRARKPRGITWEDKAFSGF